MAYPTLADASPTGSNGSGTSASVSLPSTVDAGDLLVIIIATDGDNTFSWTNFTEITEGDDGKDIAIAAAYKIADGTEDGGTESVSLGSSETWAALCYRITTGTHGGAGDPPESSTVVPGDSSTGDPSTCTPTGGSKDYLWITALALDNNSLSGATVPSGYGTLRYEDSPTPGGCSCGSAERTNTAASEDAGAWSHSNDEWCALTLAVHPASADRHARVSWAELEVPTAPRKAHVSWAELETPDAARQARVSWAELETPVAGRQARVSWAELEVPTAPRRGQVSWAELEVPAAARQGRVSWAELETPDAARFAVVSWAELEVPVAARQGRVSWAELETPVAARQGRVSWAELEVPDVSREARVSWAELEVPTAPRRGQVSWAELEVPSAVRRALVSWAELQVPEVGGGNGPGPKQITEYTIYERSAEQNE